MIGSDLEDLGFAGRSSGTHRATPASVRLGAAAREQTPVPWLLMHRDADDPGRSGPEAMWGSEGM